MSTPGLALARRVRRTPFTDRVEAAGVRAYSVYNRMLLPAVFEDPGADAEHLKQSVQVWDVSCQRQIEVAGPDAAWLLQYGTPRDLSGLRDDRCMYCPFVDEQGGIINDPVVMKAGPQRYWVSIADGDLGLWLAALAHGLGADAQVHEADVYPLAVQGPQAPTLMARVFGEAVHALRFFGHRRLAFGNHEWIVSRSGYSGQGGFEIYVDAAEAAEPLWDALMAAGADLGVRAGGPSTIERIEAGLLSYGNDLTPHETTPYDCGLEHLCDLDTQPRCIGDAALRALADAPPRRSIVGLLIAAPEAGDCRAPWPVTATTGVVGQVTSAAWAPARGNTVALAQLQADHLVPGTRVTVHTPAGERAAQVVPLPMPAS